MTYQPSSIVGIPAEFMMPGVPALPGADVLVSILVPVKDEEALIQPFVARVASILDQISPDGNWEIIFVDDGSTDMTLAAVQHAHQEDTRVRALSLSRNFGKEAALSAGLDHARGAAVVPMDVDLQDPPEVLLDMVAKWKAGYDVVCGIRRDRSSDSRPKRLSAALYYRAHNWLSQDKIVEHAGDFRLLDRRVVDVIRRMPERNRFMKGLFAWSGFRQATVSYERAARTAGETKFSPWKLWTLAIDGITSASTAPLRVWSYIGAACALAALGYAAVIILGTLIYGVQVAGYASIMVSVLFLGGIQLISLGVLGEYVGRILIETKQRPLYVIRETIGLPAAVTPPNNGLVR